MQVSGGEGGILGVSVGAALAAVILYHLMAAVYNRVNPGVFVSEPRTLEKLAAQFERIVDPLLRFNDPMGIYAHCFCDFK